MGVIGRWVLGLTLVVALLPVPASGAVGPSVRQVAGAPGNPFVAPTAIVQIGGSLFILDGNAVLRFDVATAAISVVAGVRAESGDADGTGQAARFDDPQGLTTDGVDLYVADTGNHTIRKLVVASGDVTTIAGSAGRPGSDDGVGAAARFRHPWGIAWTGDGALWVMDRGNVTVRRVRVSTGRVRTVAGVPGMPGTADGTGAAARFLSPTAVVAVPSGLFLTDGDRVRRLHIDSGEVATLASLAEPGLATKPTGITVARDVLVVAAVFDDHDDTVFTGLRTVSTVTGEVAELPSFANRDATALTTNASETRLFVTGHGDFYPSLYQTVLATGTSSDLSPFGATGEVDATGPAARFSFPGDVATDGTNLYVVDDGNQAIRTVAVATGAVDTLASGLGGALGGVTRAGGALYLGDGNKVSKVDIATGQVTTAATFGPGHVNDVTIVGPDMYVVFSDCALYRAPLAGGVAPSVFAGVPGSCGSADGVGSEARFGGDATCPACPPLGITNDGTNLYVADHLTVRKVSVATAAVSTLTAPGGSFDPQDDIAVTGGRVYVTRGGFQIVAVGTSGGPVVEVTTRDDEADHLGYAPTPARTTFVAEARGLVADPDGGTVFFTNRTGVGVLEALP